MKALKIFFDVKNLISGALEGVYIYPRKLGEVAGHGDSKCRGIGDFFSATTYFSVSVTPDYDCGHCKEPSI